MTSRHLFGLGVLLVGSVCGIKESAMADIFTEDFGAGNPLFSPAHASIATAWQYSDAAHTSNYPKLVNARGGSVEVSDSLGNPAPALYSAYAGTNSGFSSYSLWAIDGTASARVAAPVSGFVLEYDVKFQGTNYEGGSLTVFSDVSWGTRDWVIAIVGNVGGLYVRTAYLSPDGAGFGITESDYLSYTLGAGGDWRDGAAWHHLKAEVQPSTVTTWTPGTPAGAYSYTGGALAVAADGFIKVWVDGALVINESGLELILNFDGESANESSPGSWTAATTLTQVLVNGPSLLEIDTRGGSAILDNITFAPREAWVPIANYTPAEINSASYPAGTARVLCDLWAGSAGVGVQARLYNVTDGASAGASATITSTDATDATFAVALASGIKTYRMEVTADDEDADIFCQTGGLIP